MPDDIAYHYIPFTTKGDESQRIVEGYVSSPAIDCDEQIVDQEWLKGELPAWLAQFGNIREQHNPLRAVGKAQTVDVLAQPGPYLAARIVDDDAWRKVQAGVYNGFSVGIKAPRIVYDGTAKNGRIAGGKLIEISIVDRPANDAARFVLLKRAGEHAWKLGDSGPVVQDVTSAEPQCDVAGCDCKCGPTAADSDCTCRCAFCSGVRGREEGEAMTDQEQAPDGAAEQPEGTQKAATAGSAAGPATARADFQDAAPAVVYRPARIGEVMAMLQDVQARLEALADETDRDRDGDRPEGTRTPANLERNGTGERQGPRSPAGEESDTADFAAQAGGHELVTPERLALTFTTEADLTKFITTRVEALLAERMTQEFITKSAAAAVAEPLAAIPEIAKLAGGIARGLEALADRTKATAEELGVTKAALAETQADLARVKELAQPVKGTVFAIEKGIGIEPDRIYRDGVVPDSARRGAEAAKVLAGLSDNERREVGAAVLAEMYRARQ